MGVREVVVRSMLSSNLRSVPAEVRPQLSPVDNLTAFALSSGQLAQALWHMRATTNCDDAERKKLGIAIQRELMRWSAKKFQIKPATKDYVILHRACMQALIEYTEPGCIECDSTGYAKSDAEFSLPICQACNGAGIIVRKVLGLGRDGNVVEQVRKPCAPCNSKGVLPYKLLSGKKREVLPVCGTCKGSGVRRYTNSERIKALSISLGNYKIIWERRMMRLFQHMSAVEIITALATGARMSTEDEAQAA